MAYVMPTSKRFDVSIFDFDQHFASLVGLHVLVSGKQWKTQLENSKKCFLPHY